MAAQKLTLEQLKELLAEQMKATIAEMGLDKVDKKFGVIPNDEGMSDDEFAKLEPKEKVAKFLQAVIRRDSATIKALGEGTDTEGGYLVPDEFKAILVKALPEATIIRPLATIIPVSSYAGEVPTLTAKPSAEWGTENTAMNEQNAAFGQVRYTLSRLQSLVPISLELVADAGIDVVELIINLFTEAFAEKEDEAFTNGDGAGKPKGFRTEGGITSIAQAGAALAYDDITALFTGLDRKYRRRAVFMTSSKGMQLLRGLKDGNGRPLLFTPSESDVTMLFGKPVIENPYVPENLGTGSDETEIWFGDFAYYYIFDRKEYAVNSTTEGAGAFEKNQIIIKATNRLDGKTALVEGFAKLTGVK